jgi:TonB-dependent SusC/RagA subfamily outer membrane receptor
MIGIVYAAVSAARKEGAMWAIRSMLLGVVLASICGGGAKAQTREVTGKILIEGSQQPLVGAAISIAGAKAGTCTGLDGIFAVQVPRDEEVTLQISVPGWTGEAIVPPSQNEVTLQLERGVIQLDPVVVNGEISRRNSASSIGRLSGEELTKVPAQTVETAMQGKIAGANIRSNSGAPGGGMQINFRGLTSILLPNDPVIVVDGVVISNIAIPNGTHYITRVNPDNTNPVNRIADLNPNDIDHIEVLRGPSASAMYGPHASNGVVLITTKRGRTRYQSDATSATVKCAFGK